MATMVQQQELSAWQRLMQKYPTIGWILQCVGDLLGYFTNGQILVDLWRWAILTSGNVSEAALMFAALWITAASVEPDAINAIPYGIPGMLSAGSMFALTLLPEIVVYAAIATCYDHWRNTFIDEAHRGAHCTWAVLYSLPTLTFLIMTIYTLCSFVSIGHTFAAPPFILTARCLAGWSYGVVGLIHATINKKSPVKFDVMTPPGIVTNVPVSIAQTTSANVQEDEADTQQDISTGIQENDTEDDTENLDSISENEPIEKFYPVIEDDEFDTEDESLEDEEEDQDESDRDTDPFQNAVPNNDTRRDTNITFLHSVEKPRSDTKAKTKSSRGAAAKKAAAIIKNNPDITPMELSKKAKITPAYARRLLAKQSVLIETM